MSLKVGEQHRPLRDVVCDEIRSQIIAGVHPPGGRLVEDRLAEDLGVSRNPVREALRVLEAEGFVQMLPRRGAVVAELSRDEVLDLFEIRIALEGLAARLAAEKASAEEVALIRKLLDQRRTAVEKRDESKLRDLNTRFHEMVIAASGNRQLAEIMLPLRGRMTWVYAVSKLTGWHRSMEEHHGVLDAIEARDGEVAAQRSMAHVTAARDWYLSALD